MGIRDLAVAGAWTAIALVTTTGLAPAQSTSSQPSTSRRATNVEVLLAYPVFFNGQAVRVRGVIETSRAGVVLVARGGRLPLLGATMTSTVGPDNQVEVAGAFLDVGRFAPNDPRLQRVDVATLARQRLNRDWPRPGELLVLLVDAVEPAEVFPAPSVRALALAPERYVNQSVTVVGRFRGRNLYGDLPKAPGVSRWDFVLRSADAAVWVVGRRPKGDGFDLDPGARVDTGRWLEVHGRVRVDQGLVRIEATAIGISDPAAEPSASRPPAPVPQPPPEAIFSIPLEADEEATRAGPIRIQFSRDMDPDSFEGQVRVAYQEQPPIDAPRDAAKDVIAVATLSYDAGRRVLTIEPTEPLPPFTQVQVTLGNGIMSTTGEALQPWRLTFTTGP